MLEALARAGITDLRTLAHLSDMLGIKPSDIMKAAAQQER